MLGDCLMAWRRGDETVDAQAAARVTAKFMLLVVGALTKRK